MRFRKGIRRITGKDKRQQLIIRGEVFSRKESLICYGIVCGIVLLCGSAMKLRIGYMLAAMAVCMGKVPSMYLQYKRVQCEKKRFTEANAYMAQMTQAFAANSKILTSLKETRDTFPTGRMHQMLTKAIYHIEQASDMELAEQEALQLICGEYDSERVRTLHDFLWKAESRGGSCEEEFRLLESMRQLWEKNVLKYQNTIRTARNLVTFEYLLLMLVCIFMLRQFPEELQIIHLPLVQGLNTFLIVCFFMVFCKMDKKCGKSMLQDPHRMDALSASMRQKYVKEFQGKTSFVKHLPCAAAVLAIALVWYGFGKRMGILVFGILLFFLICYAGHIRYFYTMRTIKEEIQTVFPGWLFDVLLLMQSENVSVALAKSEEKAPAILKEELQMLKKELADNPLSSDAFLLFLAQYQMTEVENVMRKLYALNCGNGVGREVVNLLIDMNMTMLSEAEARKMRLRGDLYTIYYMLPTVPVMVCMVGYGIALMVVIFQNVMTII